MIYIFGWIRRNMAQPRLLPLAVVLLLLLSVPATAQQMQVPHATCSLEIEGWGGRQSGIRKASLACSGDTVLAAADPLLRPFVQGAKGVTWGRDHCGNEAWNCLFRVCLGTNVHFKNLRIVGLRAPEMQATVCLEGLTSVIFTNATFTNNQGSFIGSTFGDVQLLNSTMANNMGTNEWHVAGIGVLRKANVLVQDCIFTNNSAAVSGSSVRVADGKVRIVNSQFRGNSVACNGCAGGAVATFNSATVEIVNSTFEDNGGEVGGGALAASESSSVTVKQCRFERNGISGYSNVQKALGNRGTQASLMQGGAVLVKDNAKVFLQDAVLLNNSVPTRGGAVAITANASATLQRCTLANNSVDERGGAIYTAGNASLSDTWIIGNSADVGGGLVLAAGASLQLGKNVSVSGNTALSKGGGVDIESTTARANWQLLQQITGDNSAPVGPEISVPILRLEIGGNRTVYDLTSRVAASEGLVVVRVHVIGWFGLPSGFTQVEALFRDVVQATNSTDADGIALLSLKLNEDPGTYSVYFRPKGKSGPSVKLLVNVTGCPLGDVTADTGKACISCAAGSFSMNPDNNTCDACPAYAVCPGKAEVLPVAGFWSSSPRSPQMHRCRNPSACPGGTPETCAEGYEGNLCAVCSPGYGSSAPFTCRKCWHTGVIITVYVLAGTVMLTVAKALCFFTLDFNMKHTANAQAEHQPAPAGQSATTAKPAPTALLKPFAIYMQFMFLVASMQGVSWPATLARPLQAVHVLFAASSPQSLGLECVLPRNIGLPVPVQVFLLTMATPILLMVALLVWETLRACYISQRRSRPIHSVLVDETKRMVAQSIIVCFLLYPLMLRSVMGLFASIPLDQPIESPYQAQAVDSFWAGDMSQKAFQGYHRTAAFALGIPLLIVLLLVLPVAMLGFMLHHRKELYTEKFQHFSFMFQTYRPKVFYWEVVVLLQTSALVAISVFGFSLGTYYSCLALTAGLAATMVLHAWMRPYASMVAGRASLRSLACVTFTSFAALSFLPVGSVYGQMRVNQAYALTAGAFVLVVNMVYVISVAVQLFGAVKWTAVLDVARRMVGVFCAMLGRQQGEKSDAPRQ